MTGSKTGTRSTIKKTPRGIGAISYRGMMADAAMLPLHEKVLAEAKRRGKLVVESS